MLNNKMRQAGVPLSQNPELKEKGQAVITLMNTLMKLSIEKAKVKNFYQLNKILKPVVERDIRHKYLKLWIKEGKFFILDSTLHSSMYDSLNQDSQSEFEEIYKNKASHSYCKSGNRENYYEFKELVSENPVNYYIYTLTHKTKNNIPLWWANSRFNYRYYFIYKYLCSRKQPSKNDFRLAKKIFGVDLVQQALTAFKSYGVIIKGEDGFFEILKPQQAKKIVSRENKKSGFVITFNS